MAAIPRTRLLFGEMRPIPYLNAFVRFVPAILDCNVESRRYRMAKLLRTLLEGWIDSQRLDKRGRPCECIEDFVPHEKQGPKNKLFRHTSVSPLGSFDLVVKERLGRHFNPGRSWIPVERRLAGTAITIRPVGFQLIDLSVGGCHNSPTWLNW